MKKSGQLTPLRKVLTDIDPLCPKCRGNPGRQCGICDGTGKTKIKPSKRNKRGARKQRRLYSLGLQHVFVQAQIEACKDGGDAYKQFIPALRRRLKRIESNRNFRGDAESYGA